MQVPGLLTVCCRSTLQAAGSCYENLVDADAAK